MCIINTLIQCVLLQWAIYDLLYVAGMEEGAGPPWVPNNPSGRVSWALLPLLVDKQAPWVPVNAISWFTGYDIVEWWHYCSSHVRCQTAVVSYAELLQCHSLSHMTAIPRPVNRARIEHFKTLDDENEKDSDLCCLSNLHVLLGIKIKSRHHWTIRIIIL